MASNRFFMGINLNDIVSRAIQRMLNKPIAKEKKELLLSLQKDAETGNLLSPTPLTGKEKHELNVLFESLTSEWDSIKYKHPVDSLIAHFSRINELSREIYKYRYKPDFQQRLSMFLSQNTTIWKHLRGYQSSFKGMHEMEPLFIDYLWECYNHEVKKVFELKTIGGKIGRMAPFSEYVIQLRRAYENQHFKAYLSAFDHVLSILDLNIALLKPLKP